MLANQKRNPPFGGLTISAQVRRRRAWYVTGLMLAVLIAATVILELFDVDRRVAAHFYHPGGGWFLAKAPIWMWFYTYGTIPGLLLTLGALLICMAGLWMPSLKSWRKPCLLVVLTTAIAAGLLVNAVLKQYWGRPRPDQTIEFGGKWDYRPIFPPGPPGKGASFPCGHCTMGFVFLAAVGFRKKSAVLAVTGVAAGVVLGGLLSITRIVQGAHFLSDTMWSFGIVAMTVIVLQAYLSPYDSRDRQAPAKPATRGRKIWLTVLVTIGALIATAGFLTRRPYYNTMVFPLALDPDLKSVRIRINVDPERVRLGYKDQPTGRLQVDAHGFGWLKFNYHLDNDTRVRDGILTVILNVDARSYFAELDHALTVTLPRRERDRLSVMVNGHLIDDTRQ